MYAHDNSPLPQRKRTPSFSSSLLDAIYRSIDEPNAAGSDGPVQETAVIKKQSLHVHSVSSTRRDAFLDEDKDFSNLRPACLIESWMEKRSTRCSSYSNSTSSSSESSSGGCRGGLFSSSSETESSVKENSRNLTPQRQKKATREGGFSKTKLKALQLYGELKKVKQPISPGRKIASFLNSIFSSGNAKKVKLCSIGATDDVNTTTGRKSKSACSSVTSVSRSCLSKTTPSRGQSAAAGKSKRSVRFYPVSVILDEDSRPCGHKCIYEDDPGLMPTAIPEKTVKESPFKQDVAKGAEYVRNYQKKSISEFDFRGFHSFIHDDVDDSDDDDDDGSCSSSDLFELEHLTGIGRYREELPVYETTNLKRNQAIANGFKV